VFTAQLVPNMKNNTSDELEQFLNFIFKVTNKSSQQNDQWTMLTGAVFKAILQNDSYDDHLHSSLFSTPLACAQY
jgi:Na+-transporting NADH:ubiquinone oxidoreductase subunit NqrF